MSACDMGSLCCGTSPCAYLAVDANAEELAALRAERDSAWDTLDQVIGGTAQVLNCDRDNEAILEAVTGIQSQNVRLRAEVERLRGALERLIAPFSKWHSKDDGALAFARAALAHKEPGDEG